MNKKILANALAFLAANAVCSAPPAMPAAGNASGDAAQKYFNQAVEAVLSGDKATLRKLYDYDILDGITNKEQIAKSLNDLMQRVHSEAKALYRKGEVAKAADRLELTFDFTAYVADKVDHYANTPDRTPEYWIFGWNLPALHMPKNVYISALNDYGLYLIKNNQDAEALRVLQAVISSEPQREIAYLNLANALWHLGRKEEALPYLEKYKQIRAIEEKEATSPKGAIEAVLHVSCTVRPKQLVAAKSPRATGDLAPYLYSIQQEIKSHWQPPKSEKSQSTTLQFDVARNGKVSNAAAVQSSGNPYTQAALKALRDSKLPPLPAEAPDSISLNFVFSYNVLNSTDKEDKAIKQWQAKLAQSKSAENHAGLAEAYENDGDFARARQQLLLAISKSRGAQAKRYEEQLRDDELQIAEANKEIEELGKDSPKGAQRLGIPQAALNNQGANALNNMNYELAIQKFSQALNIDPGYKLARNNLGMVFNNRGIKERSDKNNALLDFHRALLLRTDDTASEANIATSIKSLIKGRDSYELRKNLADSLAAKHDDVGAIAEYRRALEIKDDPKIREPLQQITDRVMSANYSDGQFVIDPK
ncbi:MAG TPA: tetratricopeptide repeat protein [Drouetiella sp.]